MQLARYHNDEERFRKERRDYARKQTNGKTICRLCGRPVYRIYSEGSKKPAMHDECVYDDCIDTLKAGKFLDHKQRSRLYSRGYTIEKFEKEFKDEIYSQTY